MSICNWIKNKFNKPKPVVETPVEHIPPIIIQGDDFFTPEDLYETMHYRRWDHAHKENIRVSAACVKYCDSLNNVCKQYEINTKYRVAHFLAQLGHESSRLRYTKEQGSKWYFMTKKYGYRFRGRGLIQLTWEYGYKAYYENLKARGMGYFNIMENPDLVAELPLSTDVCGYFWNRKNLNELADLGDEGIRPITKRVNGAYGGLSNRKELYLRAKEVLK